MATLYEVKGTVLELQQMMEEGEVDEEMIRDTLEGVEYEFELKAQDYAMVMKNLQAQADAYATEIKRMTDNKKSLENNIERMKNTLEQAMIETGKEKFKTAYFGFNIQNNPAKLVIDHPEMIPKKYLIEQAPKPDNAAIKEYLKGLKGNKTAYAHLEQGRSLRIR